MSHRPIRSAALYLILTVVASSAWAWGSAGHWAIGEIASHYLSPRTAREVDWLLGEGRHDNLAAAGYWADEHARLYRRYDFASVLHYINVDPAADSIDMARDCPDRECIVGAIEMLSRRVVDESRSRQERGEDLLFLIHFVEDVHHPLHVVHPDGRGGNLTEVVLGGEETNLHSAWDSGLIDQRLAVFDTPGGRSSWGIEPWKQWAYELRFDIGDEERMTWKAETDPIVWATEGIEPARRLTFDVESGQVLDDAYFVEAMPIIEGRIQMAAVRLAALLNRIFDS